MKYAGPAASLLLGLSAACSPNVDEPGASGSTTSTSTGATMTTTSTTGTTTTTSTATTTTTTSTSTVPDPCAALGCAATQLCVVPMCQQVLGEICVQGSFDAGACPPGTKHSGQFDGDCPQPAFACVSGCPPAAPFCLDLPAACGGTATCSCLGADPCMAVSGGVCHDTGITGSRLTCSLDP